ncbi:MAG: Gfo/Idh/MocA family oxidoreductase, partial [Magnetospirillum sp.]|nr:Gfo/Idh/MocA family oxidoreductase [Magnetospirillum sp.]
MTRILKVGIAGYGVVGKRRRNCIDARSDMRTVAVCDRSFASDGVLEDGMRHYTHYSRLLEEDLDVLFVCLTNDIAAEVTIAGLERGLHVFCEKPPGRDVADIVAVRQAEARHPGLKLKYGFNHRYHDSVRDALALVQTGQLGRIIDLKGTYGKSAIISFGQCDWRSKRSIAGGGILLDQGIHIVDLMRLFGGDFQDIHSFVSNRFWRHDVEDNAYALMRTKDGVVAMLHS